MILKSLELAKGKKTTLVDLPQFGGQVTLTELTVEGYMRRNNLYHQVAAMKDISLERKSALLMCGSFMCVMIDPDGGFLLPESQLIEFTDTLNEDSITRLLNANAELNPPKEIETLDGKKKST